jgi:hypothetical protein
MLLPQRPLEQVYLTICLDTVRQEVYPNDSFNNESLNTVAFHCERKRRRSRIATNGLHISHFP